MTDQICDRITEDRPRSTDVGTRSVPARNYNYRETYRTTTPSVVMHFPSVTREARA